MSIDTADVLRILDRRPLGIPINAVCTCTACSRLRSTPITCRTCGYQGEPIVEACDCDQRTIERWLARCWKQIAEMNDLSGGHEKHVVVDSNGQEHFRRDVMREIAELNDGLRAVLAGEPCVPHQNRYRTDFTGASDGCNHGSVSCPACDRHPSHDNLDDLDVGEVLRRIRDLRLLATGGEAP